MPLPKPSGALAVQQLWAGPPSAEGFVLKGISFALDPGEILGVIGPSASGKSTLARAIVGIAAVRSGHVRLDGADVAQWSREELGRYIGYLPQDVELFEGSIKDNIARFDDSGPEPVIKAARQAGVHEMILRLPHGYDTPLSDARNLLSGGQRQRVGLARALYNDPALVVLDEPNSNLDAAGEEALHQVLLELRRLRRTVVIIAHRPTILTNADKLLVLRDGAVDLFGARMEVMARLARAAAGTNQGSAPGMVPTQA